MLGEAAVVGGPDVLSIVEDWWLSKISIFAVCWFNLCSVLSRCRECVGIG